MPTELRVFVPGVGWFACLAKSDARVILEKDAILKRLTLKSTGGAEEFAHPAWAAWDKSEGVEMPPGCGSPKIKVEEGMGPRAAAIWLAASNGLACLAYISAKNGDEFITPSTKQEKALEKFNPVI
jgi:hypothetical protein